MAISDTITSMYENVGNVYDVLELAGADLTNVDKNILNLKQSWKERLLYFLANGTDVVWNNWLPKVTGSGETITLNNTIEAKMDFVYKGNTSQYTTTGKNIFALPDTQTLNSKVYTNNSNGTFNISGTASANTNIYKVVDLSDTNITNGETYTLSRKSGGYNIQIDFYQDNSYKSTPIYVYGNALKSTQTITIPNGANKVRFILYFASGNSTSLTNEWVQLEKGSSDTSFEPYTNGASPNPDYPQDIQVVSGDNTIKVEGKNLASDNDSSTTRNFAIGNVEEGVNYTLYLNIDGTDINGNIKYDSASGTNVKVFYTATGKNVYTFTSSKTTKIYMNSYGGTNFNGFTEIMLVKGTYTLQTIGDYEPYVSQTYPINLGNIELCKIGTYQDRIYKDNGKWYLNKQIGKVVLNGSETYGSFSNNRFRTPVITKAIDGFTTIISMCNMLVATTQSDMSSTTQNNLIAVNGDYIWLRITNSTTEQELKTLLQNTNAIVYYPLATPTTTEITDTTLISQLEAIKYSYDSQTNITQTNDDMPFILDVVALGELS